MYCVCFDLGDSPIIPSRASPVNWGRRERRKPASTSSVPTNPNNPSPITHPHHGHHHESSSSSCNSSTPSSPALFNYNTNQQQYHPHNSHHHLSVSAQSTPSYQSHLFSFPDVNTSGSNRQYPSTANSNKSSSPFHSQHSHSQSLTNSTNELISTVKSIDSDHTYISTTTTNSSGTNDGSNNSTTDSERTLALRVDSQDSQVSEDSEFFSNQNNTSFDSKTNSWPRRQNSTNMRSSEWDIPFDELKLGEKIGTGHFGTVYRGNWHGDVAIKVLDMSLLMNSNEKTLEHFKQEVSIFRKTRHENLVLFMGACMKLPKLAIVTSLCKGNSLYTHLHLRRDRFNINKIVLISQQMSQVRIKL